MQMSVAHFSYDDGRRLLFSKFLKLHMIVVKELEISVKKTSDTMIKGNQDVTRIKQIESRRREG